jgi:putative PIN family toxin of toxin-antitoxin system
MIQAVLDTNVLVAGLRSKRGASNALLRHVGGPHLQTHISVALALEYEEVLKRENLIVDLKPSQIDRFLDYIFSVSNLTPFVAPCRPALCDPDEERNLEVAVQCGAIIVTHNQKHFVEAGVFGVRVCMPAEILGILRESL